jgi:hypothetical protein
VQAEAQLLRTRLAFVALALITIVLGLGVHHSGAAFEPGLRDVLGDALWAMMIVWWVGALAPAVTLRARIAAAFALCVLVEVSQLVHTPALDALRGTPGGRLVLGSGFDLRDLAAYGLGVLGAAALELTVRRRRPG